MTQFLLILLKSNTLNPEEKIKALHLLSTLKNHCPQCGATELSFCHHPKGEVTVFISIT